MKIVPFWMFRFLGFRAYRSPLKKIRLLADQLRAHFYLINEAGGISHFAPDYETLLSIGTDGYRERAEELQRGAEKGSDQWNFYEGVKIIAEGLARFGERYAAIAEEMSRTESDETRKAELLAIARTCRRVPRRGAESFREAVQSLFFAQIALNLESLDNSVCPGRMDQYLYPYYRADLERGILTREGAKELLSCFSIKMSEIIPVFSAHLTNFHGGMFNGQVVTVGGVDRDGRDAANELSYIFLEIMDELRMRQPNYHARVHREQPRGIHGTHHRASRRREQFSRALLRRDHHRDDDGHGDTARRTPGTIPPSAAWSRCPREGASPRRTRPSSTRPSPLKWRLTAAAASAGFSAPARERRRRCA